MKGLLTLLFLGIAVVAVYGCRQTGSPISLSNRDAIAGCLPPDLKLEDRIPIMNMGPPPNAKTVEQTLIDMGACLNSQGQLVDSSGRRIVFQKREIPGTVRDPANPPNNVTPLLGPNEVGIIYRDTHDW
jgi:hypothetical protein